MTTSTYFHVETTEGADRYADTTVFNAKLDVGYEFAGVPGKTNDEMLKSAALRNKVQQNGPFNVENETVSLFRRNDVESATRDFEKIFGGLFLYRAYEGLTKEKMLEMKRTDGEMKCKFEYIDNENKLQVSARFDVHEKIRKVLDFEKEQARLLAEEKEKEKQYIMHVNIQNVQDGVENVGNAELDVEEYVQQLQQEIDTLVKTDGYEMSAMICNVLQGNTYENSSCGCVRCKVQMIQEEIAKNTRIEPVVEPVVEPIVEPVVENDEPHENVDIDVTECDVEYGNIENSKKEEIREYVGSAGVDCNTLVIWKDLALECPPNIVYQNRVTNVIPASGYNSMECYAIVCRVTRAGYWCGARMTVNGKMEVVRVFFSTLERLRLSEGNFVLVTGVQYGVGVSCNILGRITKKVEQSIFTKSVLDEFLDYQVFDLTNGDSSKPKLYENEKVVEELSFEWDESDGPTYKNELEAKRFRREERTKKICIHQEQCTDLEQTPGVCPLCPNGINRADTWKKFLKEAVGLEGNIKDEKVDLREIRHWGKVLGWNLESNIQKDENDSDDDGFDNRKYVLQHLEGAEEYDDEEIETIDNTQVKIEKIDTVGLKKAHGGKRERKRATKGRYESRAYTRGEENIDASEKKARRGTKRGNNKKGGQTFVGGIASCF